MVIRTLVVKIFDNVIVNYFLDDFKSKEGIDLRKDKCSDATSEDEAEKGEERIVDSY